MSNENTIAPINDLIPRACIMLKPTGFWPDALKLKRQQPQN
jgi:hypothetical protein